MSLYQGYLACYDIQDNKNRKKLFEILKDHGLMPLQESVFWGEITRAEHHAILRSTEELLNSDTDKFFMLPFLLTEQILQKGIGYQNIQLRKPDGFVNL